MTGAAAFGALSADAMGAAVKRLRARAWLPIAFRLSLTGPQPDRLRAAPEDSRAGDVELGEDIYGGRFAFAGTVLEAGARGPWVAPLPASVRFREELEGFSWLRHLGAIDALAPEGIIEAREAARALAAGWIDTRAAFAEPAWSPWVVGRRIFSWLTQARLLSDGADLTWRARFHQSLAQQARYLSGALEMTPPGTARLTAIMGVTLACLALGDGGLRRTRAITALLAELDAQIGDGGGHRSRSPALMCELLADLMTIDGAFRQSHTPIPRALEETIVRLRAALRFFHIGGGRLAAFHGAGREAPQTVLALLAGGQPKDASAIAPHAGYERMSAGATLVVVDCGAAPPFEFAATTHFGALAFELTSDGRPLIVNCGASSVPDEEARVFRTAAAHSTLSFIVAKPAKTATGIALRLLGSRLAGGPRVVEIERHVDETPGAGGQWLELAQDTFALELGRRHMRRLYLSDRGADLRGQDIIEPLPGEIAPSSIPYRLRFHLHPDIEVAMEDGAVRLGVPGGEVWRFRCRGGELALAESIFNGPSGSRNSKQLVVKGEAALEPVSIAWAFRREGQDA
jgi:uncharacterized heparinase superfamily protein